MRASEPATLDEPFDRLEGMAAKRRIIALLERGIERLRALDGYTATFHRTERIKDALGRPQTIAEKVRHRPFSVYMRWISPFAGQEAIYVEGQNDGRMVAHLSGLGRILSPRTLLAPDDPLLRATSRHPITKSGLLNMNEVFLEYRRAELEQTDSRVTLKPAIEAGRPGLLCEHVHFSDHGGTYPYHRVTGFIDKDFGFITHYESYAWPALSSKPSHAEPESPLLERYSYSDIDLHPTLRDSDFSPDNPTYAFHRF